MEERVVGDGDARQGLLPIFFVAEFYFLKGEQVELSLVEELQILVRVAHGPGLLGFEGSARKRRLLRVGADFADEGQLDWLSELQLSQFAPEGRLRLHVLVFSTHWSVLTHKIIIEATPQLLHKSH